MILGIARWLDARLRLGKMARAVMEHVFPDHWSFMLGEIALYSFVVLVLTGVFLAMFFNGSDDKVLYHGAYQQLHGVQISAAYRSVLQLSFDVRAGLLIRQMHHWAALIFVAAIVAHLARLFFTGAYRRPREINWMIGVTLLGLAIINGYLGYSIGGDLLSGIGLRIAYAILLSCPLIGPWLAYIFFGGNVPSGVMTARMYGMHIFLVPALIAILLTVHLAIIYRQLHTNYPGPGRTNHKIVGSRFWPKYAVKSVGLCCLVIGVIAMLGGLVQIDPVWVYGPDNAAAALPGAQPDWYLGWIEGAMRLFPSVNIRLPVALHARPWLIPEVFFPAFLLPVLVFAGLYAYPFFDKWFVSKDNEPHNVLRMPYEQPFNTAVGCAVFIFVLVLLFAGGDDVIAFATNGSVVKIRFWLRVLVFAAPAFTAIVTYATCRILKQRHSASHAQ